MKKGLRYRFSRTNFTLHARERADQRLSIPDDELADMLDWGFTVTIKEEIGSTRVHRLFYSHPDRQCFVAVQDTRTKTVVTILPIDFYESLNHKLPGSLLDEARRKVSHDYDSGLENVKKLNVFDKKPQSPQNLVFKLGVGVKNVQEKFKMRSLGSWPRNNEYQEPEQIIDDPDLLFELRNRLPNGLKPGDSPQSLWIRKGNRGDWSFFPLSMIEKNSHA
jgi:hypothetical protein